VTLAQLYYGIKMQLETLFAEALAIRVPWKIESLSFDSSAKRLDIKVDFEKGSSFEYEDPETKEVSQYKAYDKIDKTWRHLNFFEHECYIHAKVPRIKPKGGGIKMILPPWSGVVYGFTLLFEALILKMCVNMPVHNVGKILKVTDDRLWHLLDCYVKKMLFLADHSDVTAIGVDETSLKKGHNYISLFVDLNQRKTIFITEGKDHSTVTRFVEMLEGSGGEACNIKDVSCDMSPAFIKGVREQLPEAEITFDKFHVLKTINEAVDKVRREEVKSNPILKGARYCLLKNEANLTANQQVKLTDLSKLNLKSIRALHIRENFQEIYKAGTKEEFELYLKKWYFWATHSKIKPIMDAAKTIKNHWDGILRWKESQLNNGILEGLNSIIQAAKRKARGYKLEHFKVIAYLLTGKLDFSVINNCLPTRFP
jgi:transposase